MRRRRATCTGARPARTSSTPALVLQLRAAVPRDRCGTSSRAAPPRRRATPAHMPTRAMAGRTWLQQATPIDVRAQGGRLARRAAAHRASRCTRRSRTRCVLQFGGAAGTLAALGAAGPAVAAGAGRSGSGLRVPDLPWHAHRDRLARARVRAWRRLPARSARSRATSRCWRRPRWPRRASGARRAAADPRRCRTSATRCRRRSRWRPRQCGPGPGGHDAGARCRRSTSAAWAAGRRSGTTLPRARAGDRRGRRAFGGRCPGEAGGGRGSGCAPTWTSRAASSWPSRWRWPWRRTWAASRPALVEAACRRGAEGPRAGRRVVRWTRR